MTADVPGENKLLVLKALRSECKTLTELIEKKELEVFKKSPNKSKDPTIEKLRKNILILREELSLLEKEAENVRREN